MVRAPHTKSHKLNHPTVALKRHARRRTADEDTQARRKGAQTVPHTRTPTHPHHKAKDTTHTHTHTHTHTFFGLVEIKRHTRTHKIINTLDIASSARAVPTFN